MKAILSLAAGVSMLALTSIAGAQEPIKLTDSQMDRVTAGAILVFAGAAYANAYANGYGNQLVVGTSYTNAIADPTGTQYPPSPNAFAHGDGSLGATSLYGINPDGTGLATNGAFSDSYSSAYAQLQ